uniref:US8.5 n=1 Tax=Cercopithecine alphaherpesvirus 2 TaxID=10317 RepID=Q8UZJ9_9ALPH|nr:US8.5 [Cercopithecine alphaherpesvirus 2]
MTRPDIATPRPPIHRTGADARRGPEAPDVPIGVAEDLRALAMTCRAARALRRRPAAPPPGGGRPPPCTWVAWLALRWVRGALGLGAVLCGVAYYMTSAPRGA